MPKYYADYRVSYLYRCTVIADDELTAARALDQKLAEHQELYDQPLIGFEQEHVPWDFAIVQVFEPVHPFDPDTVHLADVIDENTRDSHVVASQMVVPALNPKEKS